MIQDVKLIIEIKKTVKILLLSKSTIRNNKNVKEKEVRNNKTCKIITSYGG